MTYKGTFKNGVVVFRRVPAMKNGQTVQVKPTSPRRKARSARTKRGTAAALLKHVGIWAQDRQEVHRMLDELRESKQAELALERKRLGLPPEESPQAGRRNR